MRRLALALLLVGLLATASPAAHISIGSYEWNVTQSNTIDILVKISGGEQIDTAVLAFAVGDGGPDVGGLETIHISAFSVGAGTIWSAKPMNAQPLFSLPSGAANKIDAYVDTVPPQPVSAEGTLMTFTLTAPVGGLTDRIGETLPLEPDLLNYSAVYLAGNPGSLTFTAGQLKLVPEPSTLVLLTLGVAIAGLCGLRRRTAKQ